jgi:hypothetical protein
MLILVLGVAAVAYIRVIYKDIRGAVAPMT